MTTALLTRPVQREHAHRRQLVFAWSALVFVALLLVGLVPLMRFVPPPSPGRTPRRSPRNTGTT